MLHFGEEIVNLCAWCVMAVALVSFFAAFFLTTPYGRYSRQAWGFGVDARVAWLLQESPSFIVPLLLLLLSDHQMDLSSLRITPNILLLSMFLIHYFRRSFIYPFTIKKTAPTPFFIFLFAFIFCTVNGFMQGQYLIHIHRYPQAWLSGWQFLIGTSVFLLGFVINVHSDYILTSLRKRDETGHKIPRGGLFEYISCANFFGEIVEWAGFALACSSFVAFAFFFNTAFQLGARAIHHHKFYQEKFEDYPKSRKALIPFLL